MIFPGMALRFWLLLTMALVLTPLLVRAQDTAALKSADAPAGAIWLDSLDTKKMTSGWDGFPAKAGKSIEGKPLSLGGVVYTQLDLPTGVTPLALSGVCPMARCAGPCARARDLFAGSGIPGAALVNPSVSFADIYAGYQPTNKNDAILFRFQWLLAL